jgi:hypothetical protein
MHAFKSRVIARAEQRPAVCAPHERRGVWGFVDGGIGAPCELCRR